MSRNINAVINELHNLVQRQSSVQRYTLFPIRDQAAFKYYKTQQAAIWDVSELDFSADREHYRKLPPAQKRIVDVINAFFAAADGIIVKNIIFRFLLECSDFEESAFYIAQMYIELVHSEAYSLTIDTLVEDPAEKNKLFRAVEDLPCVAKKAQWMEKYIFSDLPRAHRLLAFACAEGIFFQSSFLGIFWFRTRGILPNVIFTNEQISKDEGLHTEFALDRYRRERDLGHEIPTDAFAQQMIREAAEIEDEFIDFFLPEAIDDFDPEDAHNYVKLISNYLLSGAGHPNLYDVDVSTLPDWIQEIANQQKGNFYEVRIGNYSQFSVDEALNPDNAINGYGNPLDIDL